MVAPRQAKEIVRLVDQYCEIYRDLFPEVRSFESFKYLHLERKTFPEIAKVVGLENAQRFNYFLVRALGH